MLDSTKHKTILIRILREIYRQPDLAPVLGFKGGTAAFIFHDLPRMSVDLDFDLLDPNKQMSVFDKMTKLLGHYGNITEARDKRYTLFWLVSYQKGLQQAKIEISKRPPSSSYEIKNLLGTSVLVIKLPDMFANKMTALLDRKELANRDLFDIWYFFSQNWDINTQLLKAQTGKKYGEYLLKCIARIENVDNRYILSKLGELLDEKTKFWAKKNLKDELLFLLRLHAQEQ